MNSFTFTPIGIINTPFGEKFGVPRQSMMMSEATGIVKLTDSQDFRSALRDLGQFSHVWLIFVFHKMSGHWRPLVETPRVEESRRGLFSTRSPDRPNPIGMSVVRLVRVDPDAPGGPEIHVSGVDILDGSPILDIKPYIPYADAVTDANSGWLSSDIERYRVDFSAEALTVLDDLRSRHPRLRELLTQMLELDPRPVSQRRAAPIAAPASEGLRFAFRVLDLDVHWQISAGGMLVSSILTAGQH